MSRHDDEYDDREDERGDDEEEVDDDGVGRSTSNPYSRPSAVRGAGIPSSARPSPPGAAPPSGSGVNTPSPVRSGTGSSSTNSFFNNRPSSSPPPGGSSSSGSTPSPQPYSRQPLTTRSPYGSDDKKDDDKSSPANRSLGSTGQRYGDSRTDDKKDDKPTSGGFASRLSGGGSSSGDKKDDKPASGGGLTRSLGGVTSRFGGGGDKKDDKPASGIGGLTRGLGGVTSRIGGGSSSGDKKDDKPASGGGLGSRLGGVTSRIGGGSSSGDKKDDKPASGSLGGRLGDLSGNRFGTNRPDDKKDNKPASGGLGGLGSRLGGVTSRFGGEKKDEKATSTTSTGTARPYGAGSSSSSSSSSNAPKPSPLGGMIGRGQKPETSSSGGSLGGLGGKLPFGKGDTSKKSTTGTSRSASAAPSVGDRLKAINPFAPRKDDKPSSRPRTSKAPKVDQGGLSLDNKLDIIGVTLLLGSLVLLLSSLSPTKGALTESVNSSLSYVFGWGAIFVPIAAFAIGVWLILRHFGDDAPVISRTRLIGLGLLFISALVLAQFVDSMQYKVGAGQDYLKTLHQVFLPLAYEWGRGGGWIGGELYYLLISNFTEIGGFMVVFIPLIVGLMLTLSLSASDLAMIVISNARNFSDVMAQRRQRGEARRAEKQQALALVAQQINVTKPAEALPAAAPPSPALPAPAVAEEQRRIPITTGGRTSTVPFRAPETVEVAAQAAPPVPEKASSGGRFGALGAALVGALPIGGPKTTEDKPTTVPEQPAASAPAANGSSGGLRGRIFGGQSAVPAPPPAQPAAPMPATAQAMPAAAQPPTPAPVQATPVAASVQPQRPPAEPTPRLGDMLRQSTPQPAPQSAQPTPAPASNNGGVQPYQRPPLARPETPAANGDAARPAASVARDVQPTPDLQGRSRVLRETAEAPKVMPPREPAAAPSPAFGRPADPPFAPTNVPRSTPAAAANTPAPPPPPRRAARTWKMPEATALLTSGVDQEPDHELLLRRAHIIEETLSSFGAPGRVVDVRTGPVVTQFGVEPDYVPVRGGKKNRVKVSAIAALDKDLQLALGAKSIRIEAPVPGKGYVGIEVPNEKAEIVHLRDVLEAPDFKKIHSPLAIALGQGVDGTPVAADLGSMPHLLIAGTTGSGKSVCVNAIIGSLLLSNTPKVLKFIMVDPKRVELTQYNGIPHLVAPVVVELERIISVLKWVTREMDERYRKFSSAGARNIEDYNKHLPSADDPMPYIVVIIDELADLMMLAPDDTERTITRIAALARATGIHLVIATQRPSVDVVTGLIKANFPARIAFAVAGNTDSRVILDQPGAERLLGRGDMLWMSGDSPAPVRLQGVFVSDNEISNITRFWRGQMSDEDMVAMYRPIGGTLTASDDGGSSRTETSSFRNGGGTTQSRTQSAFWDRADDDEDDDNDDELADGEDEMYEQAVELVRRLNKASVSLLQRRLRIGYTRAARLIDTMEERGIVGPATEGSKPRDVLPMR